MGLLAMCAAAHTPQKRLRNPGKTVDQYLESLERQTLNEFVAGPQAFATLLYGSTEHT